MADVDIHAGNVPHEYSNEETASLFDRIESGKYSFPADYATVCTEPQAGIVTTIKRVHLPAPDPALPRVTRVHCERAQQSLQEEFSFQIFQSNLNTIILEIDYSRKMNSYIDHHSLKGTAQFDSRAADSSTRLQIAQFADSLIESFSRTGISGLVELMKDSNPDWSKFRSLTTQNKTIPVDVNTHAILIAPERINNFLIEQINKFYDELPVPVAHRASGFIISTPTHGTITAKLQIPLPAQASCIELNLDFSFLSAPFSQYTLRAIELTGPGQFPFPSMYRSQDIEFFESLTSTESTMEYWKKILNSIRETIHQKDRTRLTEMPIFSELNHFSLKPVSIYSRALSRVKRFFLF